MEMVVEVVGVEMKMEVKTVVEVRWLLWWRG